MDEIIEKFTKESNCAGSCAHADSVFDAKKSLEYYLKKELKEQLLLYSVTQQSELLIAFFNHLVKITDLRDYYDTKKLVQDFLKSNL